MLALIAGIGMLIIDALLIIMRLSRGEQMAAANKAEREQQPVGVPVGIKDKEALLESLQRLVPANSVSLEEKSRLLEQLPEVVPDVEYTGVRARWLGTRCGRCGFSCGAFAWWCR